jgi:hypothetical protein
LAPEARTSPESRYLGADRGAERAVHQLVALHGAQSVELRGDHQRLEMHVVLRTHLDPGARQGRLDLLSDLVRRHRVRLRIGRTSYPASAASGT